MTDAESQAPHEDLRDRSRTESAGQPSVASSLTTAVVRNLVEHLGGRALTASYLGTDLGGGFSVADVVEGRVELDFYLLVQLEEVFGVDLWPTAEELREASRAP